MYLLVLLRWGYRSATKIRLGGDTTT